jgi:hypothetical protein
MRRASLLSLFILSGACSQEPDFDTRYEEAEQSIAEKAEAMDAELDLPAEGEAGPPSLADDDDKE